jgi:peptidoglycan lytic transglycosylase
VVWSRLAVIIGLLSLAACTSSPTRPEAARKPGGYYLDDGPGDNPPANLDQIPDAQPRVEPIKASTARPYTVFGQTYVPMTQLAAYKARGTASWYGKRYHGQPTSSGELYDMYAMTAAHPTLPIPSYARVTNLRNGKSVVVRINDRGPFHSDRLVDLSYAAAYKLGIIAWGRDVVEVEAIIASDERQTAALTPSAPTANVPAAAPTLEPLEQEPAGAYVQLGAFSTRQNAQSFLLRMRAELGWLSDSIVIYGREGLYRVHAGPYADRDQATRVAERLEQSTELRPVIITR